jgi:hypothetical protein
MYPEDKYMFKSIQKRKTRLGERRQEVEKI